MKNVSDRVVAFAPMTATRRMMKDQTSQPSSPRALHYEWRADPGKRPASLRLDRDQDRKRR